MAQEKIKTKDNHEVLIERTNWVGGPRKANSMGGQAFGKSFWYFSLDNGKNWKISHMPSRLQLVEVITNMNLADLDAVAEL